MVITATIDHLTDRDRITRVVVTASMAVIALLVDLFSATRIFQLSSKQAALNKNQKHIISPLRHLERTEELIEDRLKALLRHVRR